MKRDLEPPGRDEIGERPGPPDERHQENRPRLMKANVTSSMAGPAAEGPAHADFWRAAWRLSAAYWLCYLVLNSVLWGMAGVNPLDSFFGKLILLSFCAGVTLSMTALLYRLRHLTFSRKAQLCLLMAAAAAPLFCGVDHLIHSAFIYPKAVPVDLDYLAYSMIEGLSLFFGWSCLSLAMLYNAEVRDRERLLAAAREEALTAQMRALRYQVNPHFLFNTLNSVASLIEEGSSERASRMVLSLSTFLRTTLKLDPIQRVRLADELALQEEYLEIERERFNDRMTLDIDVRDGADEVMVPSLILQPLVENAMKHGVNTTAGSVSITISASRQAGRLIVRIENDIAIAGRPRSGPAGSGIGLRNVSERIRALFGEDGSVAFGPCGPGRFRAELDLPWITA